MKLQKYMLVFTKLLWKHYKEVMQKQTKIIENLEPFAMAIEPLMMMHIVKKLQTKKVEAVPYV